LDLEPGRVALASAVGPRPKFGVQISKITVGKDIDNNYRLLSVRLVGYEPTTIYKYRFKIILMVYYVLAVVPYGAKHYAE